MAGVLDTYRFLHYIQKKLHISSDNLQSMILGSHGDTMVPLLSHTSVTGENILDIITKVDADGLCGKAANGGAEIVSLLKTGSAYYAPAASAVKMLDSLINDRASIIPCSVHPGGAFGIYDDLFVGLPAVLDRNGMSKIVELKITEEERTKLAGSAAAIKEQIEKIKTRF
jgi:malate dehydrogenase